MILTARNPVVMILVCLGVAPAMAQDSTPAAPARDTAAILRPITVVGRADELIGLARTASQGHVGAADLRLRPLQREGELLEAVPGVIVTQHSGDGKANQYFVRGFNLDHGTDFQTRVEGMPINMPSHAHGQGYTDLNFLIPELVEYLDYRMGVYHADIGDFGSAGGAEFFLARRLERPFAVATGGEHAMARLAAGGSVPWGTGDLLVAGEVKRYDGPWEIGQGLRKVSGVARYTWERGASTFSLIGMGYRSRWNATDQIPLRAVRAGRIPRFGQVDGTNGGDTERYSLSGSWRHAGGSSVRELQLFGIYSHLSLFSNFGYFLDDPIRGDQFNQRERRVVLGGSLRHIQPIETLGRVHVVKLGLQSRADIVEDVGLHRTQARTRIGTVREDDVREWGTGLFMEVESRWSPVLRTVFGARADAYRFSVAGDRPENSGTRSAAIASPKATVILAPSAQVELYLSAGLGFHSNDARGTTITVDPATGGPAEPVDPLVRSRGAEFGARLSPVAGWRSTLSFWTLGLNSELLFVGDGGTTAPSFASRRGGITWANYYRPIPQLAFDFDVSHSRARFTGVSTDEERVPGAVESVVAAGVTWSPVRRGLSGSLRLRHFGAYPLVEDNSVRARSSSLVNGEIGYRFSGVRLQASVLNLLDARERDIQYYYTSRLPGEAAGGVDDIHFHPAEGRQVRIALTWGY